MINWDDIRFFLHVAREGSFSAAAKSMRLDHSTISRRFNALEKKLGVKLLERNLNPYRPTAVGEQMFQVAQKMENDIATLERQVLGLDNKLGGSIRVTASEPVINYLLMPHFVAFQELYPEIEIHTNVSSELVNLYKREADVAFRITRDPPAYLVGRKFCTLKNEVYASVNYLEKFMATPDAVPDVIIRDDQNPDDHIPLWISQNFKRFNVRLRASTPQVRLEAAKAGLGMLHIACFLGDSESNLRRVPHTVAEEGWDFWLLSHPELRSNARINVFTRYMTEAIIAQTEYLEGLCPVQENAVISEL